MILKTWACFKAELEDRISQFVPKTKNFTTFRKDAWKLPAPTEKAEVLGNFFASVFNRESEFAEASTTQPRPCQFSSRDPVISEEIVLKKLNNLNVTKSPGPDNIHLRILYELRYKLAIP